METIYGWLGLLLGFSGLVFIHELGHFLLAKWNGVHVHVFSIGMGPYLVSFTYKGTVYALSMIPLGGYVKMMGQDDLNADLDTNKNPGDFRNKRPGQKAAILVAGAAFNIITTIIIFAICYWRGVDFPTARLGYIVPDKPLGKAVIYGTDKPANLQKGDRVVTVNGVRVKNHFDLMLQVTAQSGGDQLILYIQRKENPSAFEYVQVNVEHDKKQGFPNIGLGPSAIYNEDELLPLGFETEFYVYLHSDPAEGPTKDYPAGASGKFKKGDRILALIDPKTKKEYPMNWRFALEDATARSGGEPRDFILERDGKKLEDPITISAMMKPEENGFKFGLPFLPLKIVSTDPVPDSEAAKAGLKKGDLVLGFEPDKGQQHPWKSGNLIWVKKWNDEKPNKTHIVIPPETAGAPILAQNYVKKETFKAASFGEALAVSWDDTCRYTVCMFATLRNLVTGNLSPKNLSGPVGIGQSIFNVATEQSFLEYLWWLGFISLNLGVMQLLPVPLLDGFHLLMVFVEKLKGSAVSQKVQEKFMYAGIAIIGSLLVLVMWTDISRLFGK